MTVVHFAYSLQLVQIWINIHHLEQGFDELEKYIATVTKYVTVLGDSLLAHGVKYCRIMSKS